MVNYSEPALDRVFSALADPTRRGVLESLAGGSLAVSELAAPSGMSLPGFLKHLRVLEEAGLIARSKEGRVVSCELSAAPMKAASAWMSRYEKFWSDKLGALAPYLYQQEELQTWKQPASPKSPPSSSRASTPSSRKRSGAQLSQAIPIVLAIILLSLWSGDNLGGLFLRKGNLPQGLMFGLISFAIFTAIFIVIVLIQADTPKTQGLFAAGVSLSTIVAAVPWILLFCFTNSFMEELWFRGLSLRKLTPLLGWAASIIVTALVFGITHSAATYILSNQMIFFPIIVTALGLVNAYVMLKTDSIWGSMFFHAGYDLLVIVPLLVS